MKRRARRGDLSEAEARHFREWARDKANEALQKARRAKQQDPEYVKGYLYEAQALYKSNQFTQALRVVKDAATRFPSDADLKAEIRNIEARL
jgi:predicted Zn-dependent protease